MKILNIEQGSPEWMDARLGIPTASAYDKIITPKTLKPAKGDTYRNQLLAEWLLGYAIDWGTSNAWTERGRDLEAEARAFYELTRDVEVAPVGFVARDDGKTGGSPDGLIGEDGGLEIKCPAIHTHVGYMLNPSLLSGEYRCQVQGYLYLTGRGWFDLMSYCPGLPEVLIRVPRDEVFMKAFEPALAAFLADLDTAKERLAEHRQIAAL